jgi:hypothetical protein
MKPDTSIPTLYYGMHTELTLDYPVCDVWPVFRDMGSWYTEYAFETLEGPSYDAEGGLLEDQVLKVTSSHSFPRIAGADDTAPEYFIVKTIKVVPEKEIVSVMSGNAYDWKRYTVFYAWTLAESASQTTILVDSYGEAELERPLPKDEYLKYDDELSKNWHRSWTKAFGNLREVVHGGDR